MTRFILFASAAALLVALAGCGAEPAQKSEVAPELGKVPAGDTPAMIETAPASEAIPIAPAPTAATEATRQPEKSRPKPEPKVAIPPRAKPVPEMPKPVKPDPHAGHDVDKM